MRVKLIVLAVLISPVGAWAASAAGFTAAQVSAGATVYTQFCAQCHGAHLEGESGPPLSGDTFRALYGQGTAAQLYDFVSRQMPQNAPGSLKQSQYLDVTAYLLSGNGMKAGSAPLRVSSLDHVPVAVHEVSGDAASTSGASTSNEIVRVPPPTRTVYAAVPAGADVNITDAMMRDSGSDTNDWLLHGRTYDNQRYSPLDQITAENAKSLSLVALVQTGMTASFESTPIVVNGVMYLTTPVVQHSMKILAVNAATGERLWEVTYSLGPFQICCGPVNRGVAVGYGMVYVSTLDDHLLALDARDGHTVWQSTVVGSKDGYSETSAPQVFDGMIIVGSAGGEWALRGFVAAYDAKTGAQRWRWMSTDPKSYEGNSWQGGGAMVWATPAIDPKLGLVIFSTGNPNPDLDGTQRKGDNLYSDSIVALDVHSGQLKWYYQEVKHDVWDYDAVSNVVLFDVHQNGETIPAAAEAGKVGWVFILDRRTGKLIRKSDPYVMMSKNAFSMPTAEGVDMLPGANGGAEWSPPAYSPKTHYLYILAMDQLMHFTTKPAVSAPGLLRLGSAFTNVKAGAIQDGPFVALDVETGKIAWQYKAPQPLIGGALATGGNLVFMGEGNGWFDAFNAKTGELVWRYNLSAGVNAPPVTYRVNGEQYIAVAAGGNFQLSYPYGDTLAIFKLPGRPGRTSD
ncbi:MAG TPA: PQQ-binding-like beta-propeller repeat protein [Steroidobacteraceae bacterium]|nr:PQQ-binding-like beta-propeller repeat protein [Steroidobacteraceae bacterium]